MLAALVVQTLEQMFSAKQAYILPYVHLPRLTVQGCRGGAVGDGDAAAFLDLGRSDNPIKTRGARLSPI